MFILKGGDPEKLPELRVFACPVCGCEFEMSVFEYMPDYSRGERDTRATCPCCGKCVYGGKLVEEV